MSKKRKEEATGHSFPITAAATASHLCCYADERTCSCPALPSQVDETLDMSEERKEEATDGSEVKVWGNLVAFVERLDDEMFKSLQVGGLLIA